MQIPDYLVNENYNDRYFDVVNAFEEARLLYIQDCGILEHFSNKNMVNKAFIIGETGFGAGRILVALMDFLDRCGLSDMEISYNTVELHPITPDRMASILGEFRAQAGSLIDLLVTAYSRIEISRPGWHRLQFERSFGLLNVNLWIGEALEMVNALPVMCDTWFLDGHGPKKNPSIWRPELLMAIGERTRRLGTCATFSVAGNVRRGLAAAGFTVERYPGFGGKKSILRGIKT